MKAAIWAVVTPNPMTRLNVGSITVSQASSPSCTRSLGFTAKDASGSAIVPRGIDVGRFLVRVCSQDNNTFKTGVSGVPPIGGKDSELSENRDSM
jgi:hypothetical protein